MNEIWDLIPCTCDGREKCLNCQALAAYRAVERERDEARDYIIAIWGYCGEDLRAYAPRLHEKLEQEPWLRQAKIAQK